MRHTSAHPLSLHSPHAHAAGSPLISFDDFCFAYGEHAVLSHIDLDIYPGDAAVLMGDNGSGKSTLLRAMVGLNLAQQGSYRFDGRIVDEKSMADPAFSKRLHQRVGFIFQDSDSQLFCASVEDEIAFGPRQMGLEPKEVERRVSDVCELLGITELRRRAPYNLSGGEQKKVAIACIVSMNPDVYLFDEPMASLDQRSREWMLGFLDELHAAGKTLVVATHDQSLADRVADYFVYFGDYHGYEDRPHVHLNVPSGR